MLDYARGDATAFDVLYGRHRARIYRYLLRHCGHRGTADELFQDVWMSVVRVRATYAPSARFTTWLYTLAHHRVVDHWRATGQAMLVSIDEDSAASDSMNFVAASRTDEPETVASSLEAGVRIRQALAILPPVQRDAFLLQHESGLSLAEIAALTGVSVETVKSRLRYAIGKLRASLRELA